MSEQLIILGSSGFIGSEVARYFKSTANVLGIDLRSGSLTTVTSPAESLTRAWWKDHTAPNASLVYSMGLADVRGSLAKPVADYMSFVAPLAHVLDLIQEHQRLILVSSAAVYSGRDCPSTGYPENTELTSVSVYGWHRILAEFLLSERHKSGGFRGFDVLRPFSLFGEALRRQVIYDLALQMIQADPGSNIDIRGTGTELRDFVHVSIMPEVIASLLTKPPSNQAWNVCTGKALSIASLAKILQLELNAKVELSFQGDVTLPLKLVGDSSRLKKLIDPSKFTSDKMLTSTLKAMSFRVSQQTDFR